MTPGSVIAHAGIPAAAADSNKSEIRLAPSSIEYSVCACRCTKLTPTAASRLPVNYTGVTPTPVPFKTPPATCADDAVKHPKVAFGHHRPPGLWITSRANLWILRALRARSAPAPRRDRGASHPRRRRRGRRPGAGKQGAGRVGRGDPAPAGGQAPTCPHRQSPPLSDVRHGQAAPGSG